MFKNEYLIDIKKINISKSLKNQIRKAIFNGYLESSDLIEIANKNNVKKDLISLKSFFDWLEFQKISNVDRKIIQNFCIERKLESVKEYKIYFNEKNAKKNQFFC